MANHHVRLDRVGQTRTAYEKNRKIILATQEVCGICGKPVDKTLKYPDRYSATIDHIIPLERGGHPSDITNLQLAHNICNRLKSDKLMKDIERFKAEESDEKITVNDLPQHFCWKNYKAT